MPKTVWFVVSVLALTGWPVLAQAPPQPPQAQRQPVTVTTIMQRPEVRVIRVAIEPNSTRTLHAHADELFHLFMPVDGTIDVTIDGEGSRRLGPWEAHFFTGGTMHAFTNASASTVQWMEVFIHKTATSAVLDSESALALAMAALAR
jgi:quercetin dioxygenase-like cupin family protein